MSVEKPPASSRRPLLFGAVILLGLGGLVMTRLRTPAEPVARELAPAPRPAPAIIAPAPPGDVCDGEDDDHDGTVDESCGCAAGFTLEYPPVPFTSIVRAVPLSDGSVLLAGLHGVSRFDGHAFRTLVGRLDVEIGFAWVDDARTVVLDTTGRLSEVRGAQRVPIGTARLPGHPASIRGARLEDALALVAGTLYRLSPTIAAFEGVPTDVESFSGDARAFISVQMDGTIHHVEGTSVRTSRLAGARPDSIYVRAANDVFAVGADHRVSRWNGSTWSTLLTLAGERIEHVAGSARMLFVHGHDLASDEHTVHSFDGRNWTHAKFLPEATPYEIFVAGDELFALSSGRLYRFAGDGYELVLDTWGGALTDVHGHSARSVFAVGDAGTVLRYDGAVWRRIHTEERTAFANVHAVRDDLAFVVGTHAEGDQLVGVARVCGVDGCMPFAQEAGPLGELTAVWAESEISIVLGERGGAIHHFDGARWVRLASFSRRVNEIEGRSALDLYAALAAGAPQETGPRGVVAHFDGRTWEILRGTNSAHDLTDVAVLSPAEIIVGGGNEGYVESGSDLFAHGAGRARRIRVGDDRGAMSLAVFGTEVLSLGRTHEESDAGDHWGENTWVLRLHADGRSRAIARDAHHIGLSLFATSMRNVFVVGEGMSVIARLRARACHGERFSLSRRLNRG